MQTIDKLGHYVQVWFMLAQNELDTALNEALQCLQGPQTPPRLAAAMRDAVFSGGGRLRPRLVFAVARAVGVEDRRWPAVRAAAAAVELMHCASLVHDDLPAFDDAELRRGKPTLHRRYDEATAILAGDALIMLAFDQLARASVDAPEAARGIALLARASGAVGGLVAGQARELEDAVSLERYHQEKTAGLFEAAAMLGALCAGADPWPWCNFARRLGLAYQVADDLKDVLADAKALGKDTNVDESRDRPSAVRSLGVSRASAHLQKLVEAGMEAIPPCQNSAELYEWIEGFCSKLAPPQGKRQAGPMHPVARAHAAADSI